MLGVYLATLAPTTAFWDTSEYIAAAKVLGIPHPPGNPLFMLMAHVFGAAAAGGVVRQADQPLCGGDERAAAGLWFLVAERWLRTGGTGEVGPATAPPSPASSWAP